MITGGVPDFLTIESRGKYGGYMRPSESYIEKKYLDQNDLRASICVSLAGRAAEIEFCGAEKGINSGAQSDLKKATDIAFDMLLHYGMDSEMGIAHLKNPTPDALRRANKILDQEMERATKMIRENSGKHKQLTEKLLDSYYLTSAQIEAILKAE